MTAQCRYVEQDRSVTRRSESAEKKRREYVGILGLQIAQRWYVFLGGPNIGIAQILAALETV